MNPIAIDFGTERTKLSYWDTGRNEPRLMHLGVDYQPYIPSLFYLGRDGRTLLGDNAEEMLEEDPKGIVDVLKRRLRNSSIRRNGQKVSPTELLTMLLSKLRERAQEEIADNDVDTGNVTMTIPARYGPADTEITKRAAKDAGFKNVSLITEPVAAARAWLHEAGDNTGCIVVLDCGGGTVDWAFLRRAGDDFQLDSECPPGGDEKVGGHDIDEEMFLLMREYFEEQKFNDVIEAWDGEKQRYLSKLRTLKERFHRGGGEQKVRLCNREFLIPEEYLAEIASRRFVEQAWLGFDAYLQKVRGLVEEDKPKILLVGGSARLKGLREAISERSGFEVVQWESSEYATVLGATKCEGNSNDSKAAPLKHGRGSPSSGVCLTETDPLQESQKVQKIQQGTDPTPLPKSIIEEKSIDQNPTLGNVLGMAFVHVVPGSFQMGSDSDSVSEKPVHTVRISQTFWMGKYPVTRTEYEKLVGNNLSNLEYPQNPVEMVSWNDAVAFCKKLTEQEREARRLPKGYEYRLPTEAEWEYAARGGNKSKGYKYSGSNDIEAVTWRRKHAMPVGQKRANELGLHDMSGNVWEWCFDWYDDYSEVAKTDPTGALEGSRRLVRGGSRNSPAKYCRTYARGSWDPDHKANNLGFRVCLAPLLNCEQG